MGITISRIEREFILKAMDEKKMPLKIHGSRKTAEGVILNTQDEEWLEIFQPGEDWQRFREDEPVRAFFSYFGHVMTFKSLVLKTGEVLRVKYPETIQKNLQRKYERVPPPEGSGISFKIKETRVEMEFPKSEEYDPVEEPELTDDLDIQNLSSLMEAFREAAVNFADSHSVKMFRGRHPETLEERIISQSGKILFLPKTSDGLPRDDVYGEDRILNEKMLFPEHQEQELLPELSAEDLRSHFRETAMEGITSVIYCPILYQQYVVGYLYLEARRDGHKTMTRENLEYTFQFAKVLAYSLKINGYFNKSREVLSEYRTAVLDISAAGLLFANPSETLRSTVTLYSDLDLDLRMGKRVMKIGGRVMRKYQDRNTYYYGIQFLDIKPEDFRFLFDYVYGRPFTEEEDQLWEGGAEPPKLSFD